MNGDNAQIFLAAKPSRNTLPWIMACIALLLLFTTTLFAALYIRSQKQICNAIINTSTLIDEYNQLVEDHNKVLDEDEADTQYNQLVEDYNALIDRFNTHKAKLRAATAELRKGLEHDEERHAALLRLYKKDHPEFNDMVTFAHAILNPAAEDQDGDAVKPPRPPAEVTQAPAPEKKIERREYKGEIVTVRPALMPPYIGDKGGVYHYGPNYPIARTSS